MKFLAAPWRWKFISGLLKERECIFCQALKQDDAESFVLWRGRNHFLMLNKYPYSTGHLLIAPNLHRASPELLPTADQVEIIELLERALAALRQTLHPEGFNIGMNIGKAAGAGMADHYHWHMVPRWVGDANFMPVVGQTRVFSADLSTIYRLLRDALSAEGERAKGT